jgi:hypothetical protein
VNVWCQNHLYNCSMYRSNLVKLPLTARHNDVVLVAFCNERRPMRLTSGDRCKPSLEKMCTPSSAPLGFSCLLLFWQIFHNHIFCFCFFPFILLSSGQCNITEIIKMHHDITSFFYCLWCGLNFRVIVIFYIIFCNPSIKKLTFNSNFSP